MNYDELKGLIEKEIRTPHLVSRTIDNMDRYIEYQTDGALGVVIYEYSTHVNSFQSIAIFARELIEYIDGLNESQDNGDQNDD